LYETNGQFRLEIISLVKKEAVSKETFMNYEVGKTERFVIHLMISYRLTVLTADLFLFDGLFYGSTIFAEMISGFAGFKFPNCTEQKAISILLFTRVTKTG